MTVGLRIRFGMTERENMEMLLFFYLEEAEVGVVLSEFQF